MQQIYKDIANLYSTATDIEEILELEATIRVLYALRYSGDELYRDRDSVGERDMIATLVRDSPYPYIPKMN